MLLKWETKPNKSIQIICFTYSNAWYYSLFIWKIVIEEYNSLTRVYGTFERICFECHQFLFQYLTFLWYFRTVMFSVQSCLLVTTLRLSKLSFRVREHVTWNAWPILCITGHGISISSDIEKFPNIWIRLSCLTKTNANFYFNRCMKFRHFDNFLK